MHGRISVITIVQLRESIMHKLLKEFKSELYPKIIPMGTALGIPLVFQNAESLFAIDSPDQKIINEQR